MSTSTPTANLDALLQQAASPYQSNTLDALLEGVASAPAQAIWTDLVAPSVDDSLTLALNERLAAVSAASKSASGLDQSPAPSSRLASLRAEMVRRGVDGFVIPKVDEHMGEYVSPHAERLAWLTGYTGSAGLAVVLADSAAIFVDGRYTLQVANETDLSLFTRQHLVTEPPTAWVAANLAKGQKLAIDPWLHTVGGARGLAKACKSAGAELVSLPENLVDAVWQGQPARPLSPVRVHQVAHSGQASGEKRRAIASVLRDRGAQAAVVTLPDSICWLLNVRGGDLPHNPMVLGMLIQQADEAGRCTLFVDERKLTPAVRLHLGDEVSIASPEAFGAALKALSEAGAQVLLDPGSAPRWVADQLNADEIIEAQDLTLLPKACKNDVELQGMRNAHRRDGAAVTTFLAWLETRSPQGGLTELAASDKLRECREAAGELLDLSFATISGSGPNGAIVHYRVTPASDRELGVGELYLVDSGGQYVDGTTDITRTVAVGTASDEMRDRYTRVLRGHIALGTAQFPTGTTGSQLDMLARAPLWEAGLDYDHGTGHGVGSYLCVHEGPQRISKKPNTVALEPGMVVSNEPGYYKNGAYGIRIENLVAVKSVAKPQGAEREMLGFETLTLAPLDRRLIDVASMNRAEIAWVDAYHERVRETLTPRLDPEVGTWLAAATAPLGD